MTVFPAALILYKTMKHSIFWKLVLIILPLVLVTDLAVLSAAYLITFDNTMARSREDVKQAAVIAAKYFEMVDPYDHQDLKECSESFEELCEIMDMAYVYTEIPDPSKSCKTYLSIGYGKDAAESARSSHYIGYISDVLHEEEIRAFQNGETTYLYADTQYGKTIVCFTPVVRHVVSDPDASADLSYKQETLSIAAAEMSVDEAISNVRTKFRYIMLFVFSASVLTVFFISFVLKRRIQKPVALISRKMSDFAWNREKEFEPLKIKGQDEFSQMADSFNSMALEIDRYIGDISELNREKAMQETEMNIAREIQSGFLEPSSFHDNSADIHACMLPARDVGGDLYDYRILRDGSVCVIIADVSGKGVSAALFMSNAITILRQYAEEGLSPGRIMYEYNNHMAKHNPNMMFITTFIAIYHPDTRELVYSNAGHNPPYILSDGVIGVKSNNEAAAGLFEDETYTENSLTMKPGDTLFMYTDGVTEARSKDNDMYGDDRLKNTLSGCLHHSGEEVLTAALGSVKEFSADAEQSDDITILTLTVPDVRRYSLKLDARTENLQALNKQIASLGVDKDDESVLRLIAEEMFVNICSYAYKDGGGRAEVIFEQSGEKLTMTFIDSGFPFDPTGDIPDVSDYDVENDIGGLGRFITFEIADEYSYQYKDGKNILTITKDLGSTKQ